MRIVFMGTPDFAYVQLKAIIESGHEVVAVVTQPDKPNTRGNKIIYSPVKVLALENSIEVLQPTNIKSLDAFQEIQTYKPEIIIAVAYGQLLSKEMLQLPKYGCINIHASLLPKYRGSAPIHWSIINGEVETGVTTMYMDIGMDTGDMIYQERVSIGEYVTVGELYDELAALGASLILKTLSDVKAGLAPREKQDESKSTYAPLLSKDTGKINWHHTSKQIANLVRGTNPWPVAFTNYAGQKVKVLTVQNHENSIDKKSEPGTIIEYVKNKGLLVKTGDGAIYLNMIQFPNKKKMNVDHYMLGNTIDMGTVLGK